jgi:hypothetical protein
MALPVPSNYTGTIVDGSQNLFTQIQNDFKHPLEEKEILYTLPENGSVRIINQLLNLQQRVITEFFLEQRSAESAASAASTANWDLREKTSTAYFCNPFMEATFFCCVDLDLARKIATFVARRNTQYQHGITFWPQNEPKK